MRAMPAAPGSPSYRSHLRLGPDPVTEADATAEVILRTVALRRKLLMITIAVSIPGGVALAMLYVTFAIEIYGRVIGGAFAVGAMLTFAVMHRVSGAVARIREARWTAELAQRHELSPAVLTEALAMFRS